MVAWMRRPLQAPTAWAQAYGDVVALRSPGPRTLMLFHPDLAAEVLIGDDRSFRKAAITRAMSCITGDSVLTASGPTWRHRRRLLDPAFQSDRLQRYAACVPDLARTAGARWVAQGGQIDLYAETLSFMFDLLMALLSSAPLGRDRAVLRDAFRVFWDDFSSREFLILSWLTNGSPYRRVRTPRRRRQEQLLREFDQIVARLTAHAERCPGDDLLTVLVQQARADGTLSERSLRDDIIMLVLAAWETTALGLTMALDQLARHPEAAARLRSELEAVLQDRPVAAKDLSELPYLDAVVRESLRLFPPLWGVSREATRPTQVGGYPVAPGELVVVAAGVMHRDPRWWGGDAAQFRPERWMGPSNRPRLAWMPFGAGAHLCIGMRFALMEIAMALATWGRQLVLSPVGPPPELVSTMTVQPKRGVPARVRAIAEGG